MQALVGAPLHLIVQTLARAMSPPQLPLSCVSNAACQHSQESGGSTNDTFSPSPSPLPVSPVAIPSLLSGYYQYQAAALIGQGTFATVIKAFQTGTNPSPDVAIKLLQRGSSVGSYRTVIRREIFNQSCLQHPFIVSLNEVFLTPTHLALAMEYAPGGNILQHLNTLPHGPWLPEHDARFFFQQLIVGLDYCHKKGVALRDIKLENMLLTRTDGMHPLLKICDFGYSKHDVDSAAKTRAGTPVYMAPEVLLAVRHYDAKKGDLWSCGVVLFTLLYGRYPFDHQDKYYHRKMACADYTIPVDKPVSAGCAALLQGLLVADPDKRMAMEELLSLPWFQQDLPQDALLMNSVYLEYPLSLDQYMTQVDAIIEQACWPGLHGEDLSRAHAVVPKTLP